MEIFFVAKRAFRKASVGVLTRETSYPEARETSAELMVSSSVMIVSVHVARTLDGRPGGRAEHTETERAPGARPGPAGIGDLSPLRIEF